MGISREKQRRLAQVARLYYLEDCKQSDIAKALGVSRPLISRMLTEARQLGVVEITIHEPGEACQRLLERLGKRHHILGGALVEDGVDDRTTNYALSQETLALLKQLNTRRLGVGWGHFIGQLVSWLEQAPATTSPVEHICPLVGNAGIPIRNYHSNENVRLMAQHLGATPHFLYLPALAQSLEEKQVLCSTALYQQIQHQWDTLDTVLVNIGNYPSTPDFASRARYGDQLQKQRACGRLLAYFFNEEGELIDAQNDFAIQAPIAALSRCANVVGVCSANTAPRALLGALNTGLFTHIIAREQLVRLLLDKV